MPKIESTDKKIVVVDDHEVIFIAINKAFGDHFGHRYSLHSVKNCLSAQALISRLSDIELIILDLCLPLDSAEKSSRQNGLNLLSFLMNLATTPNLLILSAYIEALSPLKNQIAVYPSGFGVADKCQSIEDIIAVAEQVMKGYLCLPPKPNLFRQIFTLKDDWIEVAKFRFQKGLTDREIAQRLHISTRTVKNYWLRLQEELHIQDDSTKDIQILIMLKLRQLGYLH